MEINKNVTNCANNDWLDDTKDFNDPTVVYDEITDSFFQQTKQVIKEVKEEEKKIIAKPPSKYVSKEAGYKAKQLEQQNKKNKKTQIKYYDDDEYDEYNDKYDELYDKYDI
jgi:hypothetical protein